MLVGSFTGTTPGGRRHRFMTADGRTVEVPAVDPTQGTTRTVKGEAWLVGRVAGTLVEF